MSETIYVADDEEEVRILIGSFLEKEGYNVRTFESGDLLYDAFLTTPCDLVILDVMMPGDSGFVICAKLRATSGVPIIMLTARNSEEDYISGMTLGSDDYFTKPFSPAMLVMRVKAMFRRIEIESRSKDNGISEDSDDSISFGDIVIHPVKLTAYCNSAELGLTNKEFNLLKYLLKHPEKAVAREALLSNIWGYDYDAETRVTDDTVKRIRRKLSAAKSEVSINTVWGHGFKIIKKEV